MSRPDQPLALNLARLVHRLMVDPRGWRVDRLMDELGIRPRTYRKYRGLLRDHLEHLIDPSGGWQVVEIAEGEARYLRLHRSRGPEELQEGFLGRIATFWLARQFFDFTGDSTLRGAADSAWADLLAGMKDRSFTVGHLLRNTDRMLHFVPHAPKSYDGKEALLQGILQALFFRRQVSLHYRAVSSDETREHTLCPLTLTLWRSALYLVAAYEADQRPYLFAVDRIVTLEPTGERFAYPPPDIYDPEEYFAGAFGIFQPGKGELVEVVLHFADDLWLHRYLKERAWHTSQSFSLRPDGRLEHRFQVSSIDEVIPWVRSFGDVVEPIAPHKLVAALARTRP